MLEWPKADGEGTETKEFPNYPGIARAYAEMVLAEEIPAGLYVKQACRRYLDMLEEAERPDALFYFSDAWSCDFLSFFERCVLPSGGKKGDRFVAQPFQILSGCSIFGFRRNDPAAPGEIGARLVREVYIEVPRGSGKSPFAAVISLYCWLHEEENGSQIFIGAPKEEQANYVFDPMKAIVENTPGLQDFYGIECTTKVLKRKAEPMARVRKLSSIADREDGANPHVVVMEELHAQDEGLFLVMDSSLGKRINNLFLSITTAGNRPQGVCWNTRRRLIAVLAGQMKDDSFFGLIYTLDKHEIEDKRIAHDPSVWPKANPMWGITVFESSLRARILKAKEQSPAAVLEVERTRLNIWSNSAGGLIDPEQWAACAVPNFDLMALKGARAWLGGDLASKNDITSIALLIEDLENSAIVWAYCEHFVPSRSKSFLSEDFGAMYEAWCQAGWVTKTHGFVADYNHIEERIRFLATVFNIEAMVFDSYQSNQILASLFNDGFPAFAMQPGFKTLSDPFKDIQANIQGGLLRHDGNPCTGWMAENVVGYYDKRENVLPQKESPNSPYKIDGIAAMTAANVARCDAMLDVERKKVSVYEKRGLHGAR